MSLFTARLNSYQFPFCWIISSSTVSDSFRFINSLPHLNIFNTLLEWLLLNFHIQRSQISPFWNTCAKFSSVLNPFLLILVIIIPCFSFPQNASNQYWYLNFYFQSANLPCQYLFQILLLIDEVAATRPFFRSPMLRLAFSLKHLVIYTSSFGASVCVVFLCPLSTQSLWFPHSPILPPLVSLSHPPSSCFHLRLLAPKGAFRRRTLGECTSQNNLRNQLNVVCINWVVATLQVSSSSS